MRATATVTRFAEPAPEALRAVIGSLASTAADYDRDAAFPAAGIQALHDAGLLTPTVAQRHGGPGLGVAGTTRILGALGEGDPSVALIAAMTLAAHAAEARYPQWPAELYERVLAQSERAPTLLNAARVEPGLGSPARGGLPATTARRTASGWAIDGVKRFVTGAEGLSWFLVWATTDEPRPRVGTFAVPGDVPGITITGRWDHLGLRASGSHDVAFHGVEIPEGHLITAAEHGPAAEQDNLAGSFFHLPLAALYLGVARAGQRAFHDFARHRVPANLGRPVAETERFRRAAGEIELLISTAERLVHTGAERVDAGDAGYHPSEALAAKALAARHAVSAVDIALSLLGNPGLTRTNPLERHFRNVRCAPVHAPQEDTVLLTLGTRALAATDESR